MNQSETRYPHATNLIFQGYRLYRDIPEFSPNPFMNELQKYFFIIRATFLTKRAEKNPYICL